MNWLATVLALLKLVGALVEWANATRIANETKAAALGRVILDAQATIKTANDARAAAAKRDATPDGLQRNDGWQRD